MASNGYQADPLSHRGIGRSIALATLVVVVMAFVFSIRHDDSGQLPGIALGSPFLLDLERAILVGSAFTAITIFAVRGWNGYFPSKLTTSGAEYPDLPVVIGASDALIDDVDALHELQSTFAKQTRDSLRLLAEDINVLDSRITAEMDRTNTDDRL